MGEQNKNDVLKNIESLKKEKEQIQEAIENERDGRIKTKLEEDLAKIEAELEKKQAILLKIEEKEQKEEKVLNTEYNKNDVLKNIESLKKEKEQIQEAIENERNDRIKTKFEEELAKLEAELEKNQAILLKIEEKKQKEEEGLNTEYNKNDVLKNIESLKKEKEQIQEAIENEKYNKNNKYKAKLEEELAKLEAELEKNQAILLKIEEREKKEEKDTKTEPQEDKTEPQEDKTEPQEDKTEPQEDKTEPQEDKTEPEEDKTEPEEDKTEPQEEYLTFEEILSNIGAAKNAVSDAEYSRYQSANGPWLVPVQKDKGDWLRNITRGVVSGIMSVINIPRKIINKLRTTDEIKHKIQTIQENVNNLSEDDFFTLKNGLEGYKGHENKVSVAVWEAVKIREARDIQNSNNNRNMYIKSTLEAVRRDHQRSIDIENEINSNNSLTTEQIESLLLEKKQIDRDNAESIKCIELSREVGAKEQGGSGYHGLEEENRARSEGSNMSGRTFARRYSQNDELEQQQAALRRLEREARKDGNDYIEVASFLAHEDLLNKNTFDKNVLGIRISKSDRHHEEGIFNKSYQNDDLLRNTLLIATTAASIFNIYRQIENERIINEANQNINSANEHNNDMSNRAEQMRKDIVDKEKIVKEGTDAAETAKKGATWAAGHEHAGTAQNYMYNWGHSDLDEMFHKTINGTMDDKSMTDMIRNADETVRNYAAAHPEYDYTALLNSMKKLGHGGIEAISTYNKAMKTLVENAINSGEFSAQTVGTIAIHPTYLETMIPVVLAGYSATSKEYQIAQRRAERRMKNENYKKQEKNDENER